LKNQFHSENRIAVAINFTNFMKWLWKQFLLWNETHHLPEREVKAVPFVLEKEFDMLFPERQVLASDDACTRSLKSKY
jgi:hypothetical protein